MTPNDDLTINFLLTGVGGQGIILASDVVSGVGLELGRDVKKAEVHGMSQRGGSVISHVRWGEQVFSPIIARGEANVLLAFERLEAARFVDHLRPGGVVLADPHVITPITVSAGGTAYPDEGAVRARLARVTSNVHWIEGVEIAEELGNARVANVVLLGALSALLDMDSGVWLKVIEGRVPPRHAALNREAFHAGRDLADVQP